MSLKTKSVSTEDLILLPSTKHVCHRQMEAERYQITFFKIKQLGICGVDTHTRWSES